MKKISAIIVCLFMIMPFFAKSLSANQAFKICLNSGIIGYYSSVSNAAFKMINLLFSDMVGIGALKNTAKKPVRENSGQNQKESDKAILPDTQPQKQKIVKANVLLPFSQICAYENNIAAAEYIVDETFLFGGWLLLLIMAILLSVRKRDGNIAPENYFCI